MTTTISPQQRDALARSLAEREVQLRREIDAVTGEIEQRLERAGEREVGDDRAAFEVREDIGLDRGQRARDVEELREVHAALERLTAGTYGACVDCEADIPLPRLLAQPAAPRCIDCQARVERAA